MKRSKIRQYLQELIVNLEKACHTVTNALIELHENENTSTTFSKFMEAKKQFLETHINNTKKILEMNF